MPVKGSRRERTTHPPVGPAPDAMEGLRVRAGIDSLGSILTASGPGRTFPAEEGQVETSIVVQ